MNRGKANRTGLGRAGRVLLLACLLFPLASGCGNSASPEQTAAIAELQRMGARINVKRGGYEIDLADSGIVDRDLAHLGKIANVKVLDLRGTLITDAGLEQLKPIASLEVVELSRTRVSDEGFESLKKSLPNASLRR